MIPESYANRGQACMLDGRICGDDRPSGLQQDQKLSSTENSQSNLMGNHRARVASIDCTMSYPGYSRSNMPVKDENDGSAMPGLQGPAQRASLSHRRDSRTGDESGVQNSPSHPGDSAHPGRSLDQSSYMSRSWHEKPDEDIQSRRIVISEIVALLESCKPKAFVDRHERLVDLARRLELALYKQSKTKDEYMDRKTLRHRVRELAKQSTSQASLRASQQIGTDQHATGVALRRQGSSFSDENAPEGRSGTVPQRPLTAQEQDQRNQILRQRQQRLLLLKHASRCMAAEGQCKVTPHCSAMKRLWKHIPGCKDPHCPMAHCISSRYVLSHFHRCKNDECPVCKPVKIMSQRSLRQRGYPPAYSRMRMNSGSSSDQTNPQLQDRLLRSGVQREGTYIDSRNLASDHSRPGAIDPRLVRRCISGTGPSLPLSMRREQVEKHIQSLRIERIQVAVAVLLRKLMENKHNKGVFNIPVDHVALNIPEYPKIVKNPMDLGTVRSKLDQYKYRTLEEFRDDVFLVFNNALCFNPPDNDYHIRAQHLLKITETELPKIAGKLERDGRKRGETCRLCFQSSCATCPLCNRGCIGFEPKALFCSGACAQRISRNAVYYSSVGNNLCWCADCFDRSKGGVVQCNNGSQTYDKHQLLKKKNDELYGEPWVNCDICEKWMHQVCALFNGRKNIPGSSQQYVCPLCLIQESKLGEAERAANGGTRHPALKDESVGESNSNGAGLSLRRENAVGKEVSSSKASSVTNASDATSYVVDGDSKMKGKFRHITLPGDKPVPSAEALQESRLSCFLQMWLRDRVAKFQSQQREAFKEKKESGTGYSEEMLDLGPGPEKLHVRVLSNYDELCKVKPYVKSVLPNYSDVLNYRSRCILLFQELDGVDVLFFMMFVQEYGSNCPPPNQRKVYIAYLDSVYYFRPRRMRTMVYHELLLAYLEHSRRLGFTSAYIWACPPPNKRDDYIIHCHPEDQRVQTADRLRKWYHEMIRVGSAANIFLGSCTLFEEHFESVTRPAAKGKKKAPRRKSKAKTKNFAKGSIKGRGQKGKASSDQPASARAAIRSNSTQSLMGTPSIADDDFEIDDDADDASNFLPDLPDIAGEDDDEQAVKSSTDIDRDSEDKNSNDEDTPKADSIYVWPGNGLLAGDDRMFPEDMERRKANKLCEAGHMPYFDGDYWPQEAEDVARDRERELKKKETAKKLKEEGVSREDDGRTTRKRRHSALGADVTSSTPGDSHSSNWNRESALANDVVSSTGVMTQPAPVNLKMSREEIVEARTQLIQRLSGQLDAMKDDFLVVKMSHECMRCGKYLLRGRWECRHPDCRANSGFGKPCPFSLCNVCYTRERSRPIEHQHGGGCIAPGDAGEPRDEESEKKLESGGNEIVIDVNKEARRKAAEEQAKSTVKTEKSASNVSQEGYQGDSAPRSDSTKNIETQKLHVSADEASASRDLRKRGPTDKSDISGVVREGVSPDVSPTAKKLKTENEKNTNKNDAVVSDESTAPSKVPESENGNSDNTEKEKKQEVLMEWRTQEIGCTRKVYDEENSHILHYVDEKMPMHTPDHDTFVKNELLETRHAFLSLCAGNRYQFDQLRRAKHSTMMVLYHLHNPDAPAHLYTCAICEKDILEGKRYHCDVCNNGDFDICGTCRRDVQHQHPLVAFVVTRGVNAETNEAQRMQRVSEMRRARKHSLALFLQALVHSSTCTYSNCGEAPCRKMKDLLKHRMECTVRVRGGCEVCRRVLCLVQMHARTCKISQCQVPHCEDLKTHIQQQIEQAKRRQLQLKLQAQQHAGYGSVAAENGIGSTDLRLAANNDTVSAQRGRGRGRARGRGHVVGNTHQLPNAQAHMQATVVEGSGGTRLKIRPALARPVESVESSVAGKSRGRGRGKK